MVEYKVERISEKKIICEYMLDGVSASECTIDISRGVWVITGWFTKEGFKHNGYGKKTMKYLLDYLVEIYGQPGGLEYVWNGQNDYVYEFIQKHFDAKCKSPIAVQKYQAEDDWESHMYVLNADKVFEYYRNEG